MKLKIILGSLILVVLVGCGGESSGPLYITSPNGLTFNVVSPVISYQDSVYSDESHLYAVHVTPGYYYTVYLDTIAGDSDLYLYYDYTLGVQSLLGYSEEFGTVTDSFTFYSDFAGTIYIEVYGAVASNYLLSVNESIVLI